MSMMITESIYMIDEKKSKNSCLNFLQLIKSGVQKEQWHMLDKKHCFDLNN